MIIGFIGFGNMAKAMVHGLKNQKHIEIRAAAPSLTIGINKDNVITHYDNLAIIGDADVVVLAVKPAQLALVYTQIASKLPAHCLVISIVSGVPLAWFTHQESGVAVVRAMPNIASAISKGATPLIANAFVSDEQKNSAKLIFKNTGIITWVDNEVDIDAFTALSGSGPAYVFLFMEAMIKAAMKLGIDEETATTFTLQTFNGAISLACNTHHRIEELRTTVTSPAGTTAAAIETFKKHDFDKVVYAAMEAAFYRAQALGIENKFGD